MTFGWLLSSLSDSSSSKKLRVLSNIVLTSYFAVVSGSRSPCSSSDSFMALEVPDTTAPRYPTRLILHRFD